MSIGALSSLSASLRSLRPQGLGQAPEIDMLIHPNASREDEEAWERMKVLNFIFISYFMYYKYNILHSSPYSLVFLN